MTDDEEGIGKSGSISTLSSMLWWLKDDHDGMVSRRREEWSWFEEVMDSEAA